jgi:hypothetical protein
VTRDALRRQRHEPSLLARRSSLAAGALNDDTTLWAAGGHTGRVYADTVLALPLVLIGHVSSLLPY